jgi:predicted RNA-binding Zn-ribbon protein involved in translation (DUF1610 family)
MSERTYQVRTVGVEYVCDQCGAGTMQLRGNTMLMSNPPQYPHQCDKCGHRQDLLAKYPTYRVERVESMP